MSIRKGRPARRRLSSWVRPAVLASAVALALAAGGVSARDVVTVTGNGPTGDGGAATAAHLQGLDSVAVAADGTVYITEGWSGRIRRVDGTTGVISHFAGIGGRTASGDGGAAVDAGIGYPIGVTVAADDSVYFIDTLNNTIRRVDTDGTISTVAGNGTAGYSGDGGPASAAQFNGAAALAFDADGNLFVVDAGNNAIRRIDAVSGAISTVVGTGTAGYSGDGGAPASAQLAGPQDLAFEADGDLLIADTGNQVIRRVHSGLTIIETLVGNPLGEDVGNVDVAPGDIFFAYPQSVAVGPGGEVYIVDRSYNLVRRFDGTSVDLIAGSGVDPFSFTSVNGYSGDGIAAAGALMSAPSDAVVLPGGDLLVVDGVNGRVRRVVPGGNITTFAGGTALLGDGGGAEDANNLGVYDIEFDDDGNLFFTDRAGQTVRRIDAVSGEISTVAGSGLTGTDEGPALTAKMWGPTRLLPIGSEVAVIDRSNHALRFLTDDGELVRMNVGLPGFAGDGGPIANVRFRAPNGLALKPGTSQLYIADTSNHRIRIWDFNTDVVTTFAGGNGNGSTGDGGSALAAKISAPFDLQFDGDGNLYFLELNFGKVRRITPGGVITTIAGTGSQGDTGDGGPATAAQLTPHSLAYDGNDRLYVSQGSPVCAIRVIDLGTGVIDRFAGDGTCFPTADGPALSTGINQPFGIAWNGDSLYIAEIGSSRIRKVQPGAPSPPLSPYATAGDGSAYVQFSGPASNDGSPVTGYTVTSLPAGGVDADAGSLSDTHLVTGLTNGETYQFVVVATNAYGTSEASTASNAIVPFEPPSLAVGDLSVVEGNSGYKLVTFVVSMSEASGQAVTFDYDTVDGTASAGSDYLALHGSATIPIGATSTTVVSRVYGDTAVEDNETFTLQLSDPIGATLADEEATATIVNNDGVTLRIGNASVLESLTANRTLLFTINLSAASPTDVGFDIATADGTAAAGSDYVAASTHLVIPAGTLAMNYAVTVRPDTLAEGDETMRVVMSNPSNATLNVAEGIGTIRDAGAATLTVADVTVLESTTATRTATFQVKLSAPATAPVTFDVATSDGTATAGSDYVAASATTATIPAGQSIYSFPVTVNPDLLVEGPEAFNVIVGNVAGATLADGAAVGNITDAGGPRATIADVTITEGQSGTKVMSFLVKLNVASSAPVLFDIHTSGGSATGGVDYVSAASYDVTIPAGQLSARFDVTILGDIEPESDETFTVDVANLRGATIADPTALGTIRDGGTRTLSMTDRIITEGDSGQIVLAFTAKLSSVSATPVTFDVHTVGGSATSGTDFVAVNQVGLTIPAGSLSRPVNVKINGDVLVEGDEQFTIVVDNVSGATVPDDTAVGTISDNDD